MNIGFYYVNTTAGSIERQIRNIRKVYPEIEIQPIEYTDNITDLTERFQKGDMLVFESISYLGSTDQMCVKLFKTLFYRGVEINFIKEPLLNASVFRSANPKNNNEGTRIILAVAEAQICTALELNRSVSSNKSAKRKEIVLKAKESGTQFGRKPGSKITYKKKVAAMEFMTLNAKSFGGTMKDRDCIKKLGITEKTYYRYKKELKAATSNTDISDSEEE